MTSQTQASNEGVHRVIRETDSKCTACRNEVGKWQHAKRPNKLVSFHIILLFVLILLVLGLKVTLPTAVAVSELFF